MQKVLYIHGFNGRPDGNTGNNIRKFFPDAEIYSEQFDLINSKASIERISAIVVLHQINIVIANSLGAFYILDYVAKRTNDVKFTNDPRSWIAPIKAIIINPCLKPSEQIPQIHPGIPAEYIDAWIQSENLLWNAGLVFPDKYRDMIFSIFADKDEMFSYKNLFEEYFLTHRKDLSNSVLVSGTHHLSEESLNDGLNKAMEYFHQLEEQKVVYLPKGKTKEDYIEQLIQFEKSNGKSENEISIPEIVEWND